MNTFKFWAVFAIGVVAGAAVALVNAPQTGAKTRKQLKHKLNEVADYVKDVSGDFSDRAGDAVARGKDVVYDLGSSAQKRVRNTAKRVADYAS